jgi:FkbM family methyltransferase
MSQHDLIKSLYRLVMEAKIRETDLSAIASEELDFLSFLLRRLQSSYSQLFQDLWVLFETRSKRSGFFVEFGATNGRTISNTYLLEKNFGWDGIVAEPNPVFHEALRGNRNCVVSTLAVSARSGETVEFKQTRNPDFSTINTYSAADHHAAAREHGTIIPVETVTLTDLLTQARAPKVIDYMSIDTEGSEFDILAAFDFERYEIRLITAEHNFSPRRDDIRRLLGAHGYRRKFSEHTQQDDWYVKERF